MNRYLVLHQTNHKTIGIYEGEIILFHEKNYLNKVLIKIFLANFDIS